ncbi:hypothetical protein [Stenotrophomonas oahuensis]|uniref:Transmembrane protein n=1 Tax=Stenotrophomonas oahuensis TaxID=3003271 RepID=A0ABY9YJY8_9GAMM|nr:hypothetical protein [Stenotrophomonas sp. A5586]WNH51199.1 hypothetical protein PDM29_12560 [Stenotrophomonas sp. A5586]
MASARDTALPARLIALVSSAVVALCLLVAFSGGSGTSLAGAMGHLSALTQAPAPAQNGTPTPVAIESGAQGGQRGEAEPDTGRDGSTTLASLPLVWAQAGSRGMLQTSRGNSLTFATRLPRSHLSQAPPRAA